jgi:starch synthase
LNPGLKVLFLAAEADPFVKVGGLGDVAGSLPAALRLLSCQGGTSEDTRFSIDVRLVIPSHGNIQTQLYPQKQTLRFTIPFENGSIPVEVLETEVKGLPVYLISGPMIAAQGPVYTGDNEADGYKFTFFSLAALELARQIGWVPQILHANDWHTAAAVYALKLQRQPGSYFEHTAAILGIHNLPYLGIGAGAALAAFGLPPATGSGLPSWAQHVPLAMGLASADWIVAVSPTYANEILTPEFGAGLNDYLMTRSKSISGILNGIDSEYWDPAQDDSLSVRFDSQHLSARRLNKTALQYEFGLESSSSIPLLAMVTRLDFQKGVDLALDALRLTADVPWQAIFLGKGNPEIEKMAQQMERDFPGRFRSAIRYDATLSRRLYGGADALLLPSRYEPCGLAQMIAMRYGCVPIAHATGGLRDTIQDVSQGDGGKGFLFEAATPLELAHTIRRTLGTYSVPERWRILQVNGMRQDFSWNHSACQYLSLYQNLIAANGGEHSPDSRWVGN